MIKKKVKDIKCFIYVDKFVIRKFDNASIMIKDFVRNISNSFENDINNCLRKYDLLSTQINASKLAKDFWKKRSKNLEEHINEYLSKLVIDDCIIDELSLDLYPISTILSNQKILLDSIQSNIQSTKSNKQYNKCVFINITYQYPFKHTTKDNMKEKITKLTKDNILPFKNKMLENFENGYVNLINIIIKGEQLSKNMYEELLIFLSKDNQIYSFKEPIKINIENLKETLDDIIKMILNRETTLNSINIYNQLVEKPENASYSDTNQLRKNEDRLIVEKKEQSIIFGIADGAGSSGIYCGEWASYLLEKLSDTPIKECDDLNIRVSNLSTNFYTNFRNKSDDPDIQKKFQNEGSYCSLLIGWLTSINGLYKLDLTIYGDSTLFIFQKDGFLKTIYPYELIEKFENAPHLISLKDDALNEYFIYKELKLNNTDIIVAASDGFAKFLLTQYLLLIKNKKELSEFNQNLLEINTNYLSQFDKKHLFTDDVLSLLEYIKNYLAKKSDAFKSFIKNLYQRKIIPNDDCSVILITFDDNVTKMNLQASFSNSFLKDDRNKKNTTNSSESYMEKTFEPFKQLNIINSFEQLFPIIHFLAGTEKK